MYSCSLSSTQRVTSSANKVQIGSKRDVAGVNGGMIGRKEAGSRMHFYNDPNSPWWPIFSKKADQWTQLVLDWCMCLHISRMCTGIMCFV
jgi:hypothetical protein